jgi:hypothetical protein
VSEDILFAERDVYGLGIEKRVFIGARKYAGNLRLSFPNLSPILAVLFSSFVWKLCNSWLMLDGFG